MVNNINDDPIIIDGETEIDDLLLASKFAELENIKSASIMSEIQKNITKGSSTLNNNKLDDILLTENEDNSSDNDYNSTDDDKEIKELVKKEMKYRYQINNSNSDDYKLKDGLSNDYLKQFGINFEENNKDNLSELSEEEFISEHINNKNQIDKLINNNSSKLDIMEDQLSWLPNIEIINLPEEVDSNLPCEFVGEIYSIINDGAIYGMQGIYIVKSDPSSIMLDLGSVLCLENKKIIGTIIDTFGPISNPFYVLIKQNLLKDELLQIGTKIFCDRRHSTILGKAGKIKYSYLSSTNKNNNKLNINNKKSPFVNKEFKDSKFSLNSLDNELEEGEEDESESGDDINLSLNEVSCKKFVEKYENLASLGESGTEDISNINNKETKKIIENRNKKFNNKFNKNRNFSRFSDFKYPNINNHIQNSKFKNDQFQKNISNINSYQSNINNYINQNQQHYFQYQQSQFNRNIMPNYQNNEQMQFIYNTYAGNNHYIPSNISNTNYNQNQYMNNYNYSGNIQHDSILNNQFNNYNYTDIQKK